MEWEGFGWVILFHVPKEMRELARQFPGRFSYAVTCISQPTENQFHNTPNCKILCYTVPRISTVNPAMFVYCFHIR